MKLAPFSSCFGRNMCAMPIDTGQDNLMLDRALADDLLPLRYVEGLVAIPARHVHFCPLSRHVADGRAQRRMSRHEDVEVPSFKHEKLAKIHGDNIGRAAPAAKQGHLSEKRSGVEANWVAFQLYLHGAGRDEVHAVAAITDADDAFTG